MLPQTVLFLLNLLRSTSSNNEWTKSIGVNGEDIWSSTSEFIPVHGECFGTIRIGRIMSIEFDFVFGGRSNDPNVDKSEMFFRIGYNASGGTSCDAQNSRYPALWLYGDTNTLFVSASDAIGCSNIYSLRDYGIISIGTSYHLLITFNDTTLRVEINSDWNKQWDRSPTLDSHLGDEVPIWWMSDKFGSSSYNRGNGTFSDITLISKWFSYHTLSPTQSPTVTTTSTSVPITVDTLTPTASSPILSIDTEIPSVSPSQSPSSSSSISSTLALNQSIGCNQSVHFIKLNSSTPIIMEWRSTSDEMFDAEDLIFAAVIAFILGLIAMILMALCFKYFCNKREECMMNQSPGSISNHFNHYQNYRIAQIADRTDEYEIHSPTLFIAESIQHHGAKEQHSINDEIRGLRDGI